MVAPGLAFNHITGLWLTSGMQLRSEQAIVSPRNREMMSGQKELLFKSSSEVPDRARLLLKAA